MELEENHDVGHGAKQGCWKERIKECVQKRAPLTSLVYIVAPFWPFGFLFLPKISSWTWHLISLLSFWLWFSFRTTVVLTLWIETLLMHYSKGLVFSILHVNPYAQPLASRNLHSNYSWWLERQERGGKESNSDFIFWKILLSFLVLKEHRFQK